MGRIRTIKPELFKHEDLFDLEQSTGLPIRVAYMGLFTCCDREGRFKWRPRTLKLDVLPHDEVDFSRVLDALASRDFVRKYTFDTEFFGVIPTFYLHQVINNKEVASIIPAPTESSYVSITCTRESRVVDACGTPLSKDQGEGKGKEGNGTGKEGEGKEIIVDRRKASPDRDLVPKIFEFWQDTMQSPNSRLDSKRINLIRKALDLGYSPRDLCEAIRGCAMSPFHMGQNDRNTKYNGLDLIFRSADKIDAFIVLAKGEATAGGEETIEQRNARITAELLGPDDDKRDDDDDTIEMEPS